MERQIAYHRQRRIFMGGNYLGNEIFYALLCFCLMDLDHRGNESHFNSFVNRYLCEVMTVRV